MRSVTPFPLAVRRMIIPGILAACSLPACAGRTPVVSGPGPELRLPVQDAYTMRYVDVVKGTGYLAEPGRQLTVHYTGWLQDGTKFDSSHDRSEPIKFMLGARKVIVGWDTGFEGMQVGGKRRLIIPWQLAYGKKGRNKIPPQADLTFDVELIAVDSVVAPPK